VKTPTKKASHESSQPVWAHAPTDQDELRDLIVTFCAGRDVTRIEPCDHALLRQDLATNEASLLALYEAGILSQEEGSELAQALLALRKEIDEERFQLNPALEDIHINLEEALRIRAGEVAGKIHSGRSRNDQVACDLRLWHLEQLHTFVPALGTTIGLFLQLAREEKWTVLPGFTHHQHAFITTFGHLLVAHAEAWLRDLQKGSELYKRVSQCPLGAAAGFGTSWPIDRRLLCRYLGFDSLLVNSLDAVMSRLEVETDVCVWLAQWMTHCGCLAQDLILFSMEEFRWVELDPAVTTGSSIMPQKRNPDFAEVIKGKTSYVHGALSTLLSLGKGQPSGYHRDSQLSKAIGQDIWRETREIPAVFEAVFGTLKINRGRMREATQTGFLEAAEWADAIAQESKLPFRQLYAALGKAVDIARKSGRLTRALVNKALTEGGIAYQVSAELAERFEAPEILVQSRRTQGSPEPSLLEEHIESLEGQLRDLLKAHKKLAGHFYSAEKQRIQAIRKLAAGR
jgi:argininosuccinate lyase